MNWCISVYIYGVSTQIMYQTVSIFVTRTGCINEQMNWCIGVYMYLCIDSKTQQNIVCILSIERSRVSLHFKYKS
jgi:hypothetical protein